MATVHFRRTTLRNELFEHLQRQIEILRSLPALQLRVECHVRRKAPCRITSGDALEGSYSFSSMTFRREGNNVQHGYVDFERTDGHNGSMTTPVMRT